MLPFHVDLMETLPEEIIFQCTYKILESICNKTLYYTFILTMKSDWVRRSL